MLLVALARVGTSERRSSPAGLTGMCRSRGVDSPAAAAAAAWFDVKVREPIVPVAVRVLVLLLPSTIRSGSVKVLRELVVEVGAVD